MHNHWNVLRSVLPDPFLFSWYFTYLMEGIQTLNDIHNSNRQGENILQNSSKMSIILDRVQLFSKKPY